MSEMQDLVVAEDNPTQEIVIREDNYAFRALGRKTPKSQVRKRQGPGGMQLSYIPWAFVAKRLNEVFNCEWSYEYIGPPQMQGDEVIVGIRITTPIGVQEAYGGHEYRTNNRNAKYADAVASAGSKALRRAAARLGIGLDLYADDEEVRDEDPKVVEAKNALKLVATRQGVGQGTTLVGVFNEALGPAEDFSSLGDVAAYIMENDGVNEVDAVWAMVDLLYDSRSIKRGDAVTIEI